MKLMLIPIRCFTCGSVISQHYKKVKKSKEKGKTLDELRIKKICCRRILLSQADLIDEVIPFNNG